MLSEIQVRRCAQDCLDKAFKSFKCSAVVKAASKLVLSMLKNHMPLAVKLCSLRVEDGSKDDTLSKPEHLEILYMLSVVKISVPSLSAKVSSKVISEMLKLLNSEFSVLTRHVLQVIEVFFETSRVELIALEMEKIVVLLISYLSLGDKNPVDTDMSAATLLKRAMDILHDGESSLWIKNLPLVCGSLAGMLLVKFYWILTLLMIHLWLWH